MGGWTYSTDFPSAAGGAQPTHALDNGRADAFVTRLTASLAPWGCSADATTLCLNGGRFEVEVGWTTPQGQSGAGQAVTLTGDTGYFWFFSANNVEVVVKVVDGRAFNSRFWVFAGGLTNVNVDDHGDRHEDGSGQDVHEPARSGLPADPGHERLRRHGSKRWQLEPELVRAAAVGLEGDFGRARLRRGSDNALRQRRPFPGRDAVGDLGGTDRRRPGRRSDRRHRLLLVLLTRQRRDRGEGRDRLRFQLALLGLCRRV